MKPTSEQLIKSVLSLIYPDMRSAARADIETAFAQRLEAYKTVTDLLFERFPDCQALGDLPGCVDELKREVATQTRRKKYYRAAFGSVCEEHSNEDVPTTCVFCALSRVREETREEDLRVLRNLIDSHKRDVQGQYDAGCDFVDAWITAEDRICALSNPAAPKGTI